MHWVGNMLPPDVYVGRMVCAAGKITTYDGGREWRVTGAVPIPDGKRATAPIFECLDDICADPREWCPDFLDMFKPR